MKRSINKVSCVLFLFTISFLSLLISCAFIDLEGVAAFEKEITAFVFQTEKNKSALSSDIVGTINSDAIDITVPYGTDLYLIPTITYKGKAVSPASGQQQTFVEGVGVPYTVYGDDNTEKKYTVTVKLSAEAIPPVPGSGGAISFGGATPHTIHVSWTKATDNVSLQENLQYLIYYSTGNNIGTVADIEANGTPFGSYTADMSEITVTGLNDATTYYFNVIVKDEKNNKAAYSAGSYLIPDAIPPAQAAVTGVTESAGQVSIDWTDPGDADFDYIEISWTPDGTGINTVSKGTQTFNTAGLTNNTEYTFSIVTVDTAGNKSAAIIVKATPMTGGPYINYCIYTAADLYAVRGGIKTGWDKTQSYIMMADIDLSVYSPWTPIGTLGDEFKGNLNGNGHTITGLYINTTSDYQGLFGFIFGPTIIKNLTIANCYVAGGKYLGALAGQFNQDTSGKAMISNMHISGTITNNLTSGGVMAYEGGLVGWLGPTSGTASWVKKCSLTVTVTTLSGASVYAFIGGITGRQESSWKISECYVEGSIGSPKGAFVGGIIGSSNGQIYDSYSKADIAGYQLTGGLGGGTTNNVYSSYATGNVTRTSGTATTFGGLIADTDPSRCNTCYYSGTIPGGLTDNAFGTRKTPAELQMQSTFTGWDFSTIWDINPAINDGYPYLISNIPE